jgi:uroporphyrinogen-III synthase
MAFCLEGQVAPARPLDNRLDMDAPIPTLLLTRPKAQSLRFADAFRDRFGQAASVLVAPLMEVTELSPDVPIPHAETLIFSSEAAVTAVRALSLPAGLAAWCVGPRTAAAARAAGFAALEGPGDGAGMVRAMIAARVAGPCLFLRGEDVAADLAGLLNSAGIETHSVTVYRQSPMPLASAAQDLLAGVRPVLLPLFSPRSARLAAVAIGRPRAPLWLASLSAAVDSAAGALSAERREIASRPTAPAMLDALARLVADPP